MPARLPTPVDVTLKPAADGSLNFTDVMQNLQTVYPKQVMSDISTSYCFICLLHLANEKGLVIEKQEGLTELRITKDHTAEITVGAD
jgi:condensin complex subunit 2